MSQIQGPEISILDAASSGESPARSRASRNRVEIEAIEFTVRVRSRRTTEMTDGEQLRLDSAETAPRRSVQRMVRRRSLLAASLAATAMIGLSTGLNLA